MRGLLIGLSIVSLVLGTSDRACSNVKDSSEKKPVSLLQWKQQKRSVAFVGEGGDNQHPNQHPPHLEPIQNPETGNMMPDVGERLEIESLIDKILFKDGGAEHKMTSKDLYESLKGNPVFSSHPDLKDYVHWSKKPDESLSRETMFAILWRLKQLELNEASVSSSPEKGPSMLQAGVNTSSCSVSNRKWLSDGYCDKSGGYNTAACAWDGGDCCETTCHSGKSYTCGHNGYDCKGTGCKYDKNSRRRTHEGRCKSSSPVYGTSGMNVCTGPEDSDMMPCWMSRYADSTKISWLSMVGTHDTMAYPASNQLLKDGFWNAFNCQVWYLRTQLDAGIRWLDLRIKQIGNDLKMHHGDPNLFASEITWQDNPQTHVFDVIKEFLTDNPTEFVVAMVDATDFNDVGKDKWDAVKDSLGSMLYKCPNARSTWPSKTLGDVRGKVIIIRDYADCEWEDYADNPVNGRFPLRRDWPSLADNGLTEVYWVSGLTVGKKHSFIRESFTKKDHYSSAQSGKIKFIELSGAGDLFPFTVANGYGDSEGTNEIPFEFTNGHLGVIMADFPSEGLIKHVIEEGNGPGPSTRQNKPHHNPTCWGDGSLCGIGSTCNHCCYRSEYWDGKLMTACGYEPCWGKDTYCLPGTTCNTCCNSWYWWWYGAYCS